MAALDAIIEERFNIVFGSIGRKVSDTKRQLVRLHRHTIKGVANGEKKANIIERKLQKEGASPLEDLSWWGFVLEPQPDD